ncbi:TPA: hypothetical protein N2G32_002575 [Salmonella enterica]|nr:hypothetical protein [Salmonella enterica]
MLPPWSEREQVLMQAHYSKGLYSGDDPHPGFYSEWRPARRGGKPSSDIFTVTPRPV